MTPAPAPGRPIVVRGTYLVTPFFVVVQGAPDDPVGLFACLASFVRGPHRRLAVWSVPYSSGRGAPGVFLLRRWRWGCLAWGLRIVEQPLGGVAGHL